METAAARAELERLKQALREQAIDGIEWIPIPVDADEGGAGVAAFLIAAAPAGATDRLRALVGEVLDRCPWCSIPAIRLYPESAQSRVVMRADVIVFDAAATLASDTARAAFAAGEPPDAVGQLVWLAFADLVTAAGFVLAERQDRLRSALGAANMAYGGDRDETLAYALEGLGDRAEALARDLVVLTRRENDHARIVEDLEATLENEVQAPGGKLKGRLLSHGAWAPPPAPIGGRPWGDDPSMGGGDTLPDLAPVADVGGRAERIARLGAVVDDAQAAEGSRLAALDELAAIDDLEARAWRLRALGYPEIFLNALHRAPLGEALLLFREIVTSRDDRRIAGALALLRRFGRDGLDAEAIWRGALEQDVTEADVRMASMHRESLIERYAETGDASVVDALVRELSEHADEPLWLGSVCGLFAKVGAEAKAAPAVLAILARHYDDGIAYYAMQIFATFRCDDAVPFLRRGLDAKPVWRGAALRGLAAQGEAGRAEVLAWMERQTATGDAESRDEDVATALEALGMVAEPAPDVLERAAAVGPRSANAAQWVRKRIAARAPPPPASGDPAKEESSLEDLDGMREVSARLPDLAVGSLRPAAGLKHAHAVTGLAVNESAEPVVASADAGGFVQLTIAEARASRTMLIPVRRERHHAPGRTVVAWATERRLLSAGADCVVKEIDATDPRGFAVVREHRVDVPVTAIGPLSPRAMGLGDAAGRVFAIEGDGKDAPRLLAQLRLGEIRRVLAWPGEEHGFAAVDADGRVGLVDANGPRLVDLSVPVRPDAIAFVPSGMLLCHGGGNAIFVDPRTGQVADEMPPEEAEPLVVRFESAGGRDFAAFENGTATVRSGRGLRYAGRDPLALAEASSSRGVLVMATRAGWLRTTDFPNA